MFPALETERQHLGLFVAWVAAQVNLQGAQGRRRRVGIPGRIQHLDRTQVPRLIRDAAMRQREGVEAGRVANGNGDVRVVVIQFGETLRDFTHEAGNSGGLRFRRQHRDGILAVEVLAAGQGDLQRRKVRADIHAGFFQVFPRAADVERHGKILAQPDALRVVGDEPQHNAGLRTLVQVQQPAGELSHAVERDFPRSAAGA